MTEVWVVACENGDEAGEAVTVTLFESEKDARDFMNAEMRQIWTEEMNEKIDGEDMDEIESDLGDWGIFYSLKSVEVKPASPQLALGDAA